MTRIYLGLTVLGAALPLLVFFGVIGNLPPYGDSLLQGFFANRAAGAAVADVLYAIAVFWLWAFIDAQRRGARRPWEILPMAATLGLCAALPWYLYLRERAQTSTATAPR